MAISADLCQELAIDARRVLAHEGMDRHTSFRIGGPADWLITPDSPAEIARVLQYGNDHHLPVQILGRGSNVVVASQGLRGIALSLGNDFADIIVDGDRIIAEAGATLAALAGTAARHGLGGLEFASGIPGTVGGAVLMNAGAYDRCMADVVSWTEFLNEQGTAHRLSLGQQEFGYRSSIFSRRGDIICRTGFQLVRTGRQAIYARMNDLACRRRLSQPLEWPSAGSAFKRPAGHFAGKLIADSGLKGFRIGGAAVSTKHAGFIINLGGATPQEVMAVFSHVQRVVRQKTGILLEPEVRFIGDWSDQPEQDRLLTDIAVCG